MRSTINLEVTITHEKNLPRDAQGFADLIGRQLTGHLAAVWGEDDKALATAKVQSAFVVRQDVPTFPQNGKDIRLGSEVLIAYREGDADVGLVTGYHRPDGVTGSDQGVYVQIPGQLPKLFHADLLAPFEDQDYELADREDDAVAAGHSIVTGGNLTGHVLHAPGCEGEGCER